MLKRFITGLSATVIRKMDITYDNRCGHIDIVLIKQQAIARPFEHHVMYALPFCPEKLLQMTYVCSFKIYVMRLLMMKKKSIDL